VTVVETGVAQILDDDGYWMKVIIFFSIKSKKLIKIVGGRKDE
jgi:hypothetical protein